MQSRSSSLPTAVDDNTSYTAEVRFGVVMYGGVSLAVYINGVTNELYEMACSTPRASLGMPDPDGTREIYSRLSWLIANPSLRSTYGQALKDRPASAGRGALVDVWERVSVAGAQRSRLVVDVISGTSAGGINGIFLAKALANGEQFGALQDLWINQGDIGKLLNDAESYRGLEERAKDRSKTPSSLLNSDRMYLKLLDAMNVMTPIATAGGGVQQGESPLVEQVDLFVTTTDIAGSPVALRLFDKVVYERRYKQSFHFQYPNGRSAQTAHGAAGNDFNADQIPFLAFAARCTSSFPFAFEPMTLNALAEMQIGIPSPKLRDWDAFFAALPTQEVEEGSHVYREFGDGGYLDNKPFSYVVSALSQRFATVPVERKLIYVEPSPEELNPHVRPSKDKTTDPLSNAIAALTKIPSYEGIREDLQDVLLRNRRIERVEHIVRLGERDLELQDDPFRGVTDDNGQIPPWSRMSLEDMGSYYGVAFLPYLRLRVYALTDRLADMLGQRWGIDPDTDYQYALRALVRVWRERQFDNEGAAVHQTANAFLDQFDFDYRLRRLAFLLRKIDQLTRLFRERQPTGLKGPPAGQPPGESPPGLAPISETNESLLKVLVRHFEGRDPTADIESADVSVAALRVLKQSLLECRRTLLRLQRGMTSSAAPNADASTGMELRSVLALIIDEPPARSRSPGANAGNAAAPVARPEQAAPNKVQQTTVLLDLLSGGKVAVVLGAEWLKSASASQTLQESVLFRARSLLDAAASAGTTKLEASLVAAIDSMRFKVRSAASGSYEAADPSAEYAWELLGRPALVISQGADAKRAVKVEVGAANLMVALPGAPVELLDSDVGKHLRSLLGEYYLRFDSFDQMSFPLYYDTGTGEPSTVEVIRISPVDATHLIDETTDPQERRKLAGTALAHFGAFLDERWRRNDVMWGRLDGAERIITALLSTSDAETRLVREELVNLAHRRILESALTVGGNQQLVSLVVDALGATPGENVEQRLHALVAQLQLGTTAQRDRLAEILTSLLSGPGLMEYVKSTRRNDPNPEPKATLRNASRAATITGRVLDGVSSRYGVNSTLPRWLARGGLFLQGIVSVSLPGTFNQRWFSYAISVLYAFEVVALCFALVLGSDGARTLATTALVATIAAHFLCLVAGDVMQERKGWKRIGLFGSIVAIALLAAFGAFGLYSNGLGGQLCGPEKPHSTTAEAASSWFCERLGR